MTKDKNKCKCDSCTCGKYTREVKQIKVEQPIMFDVPMEHTRKHVERIESLSTHLDPLVERVVKKIRDRSEQGMKDYGVSMEDNDDKTINEWITDAQEELTDAVIYLEKVKQKVRDLGLE